MNEPIKHGEPVNRQVSVHQQIMTEMVYLLIFILLGSVILKMFVYDWKPFTYATELICLGVAVLYSIVRHLRLGINMTIKKTGGWKVALFSSLLLTIILGIFHYQAKEKQYVNPWDTAFLSMIGIFFLVVLLIQAVLILLLYYREHRKRAAIEAKYREFEESADDTVD